MEASWLDVFLFGEESVQYWYLQTGFLPFPVEFFCWILPPIFPLAPVTPKRRRRRRRPAMAIKNTRGRRRGNLTWQLARTSAFAQVLYLKWGLFLYVEEFS